MHSISFNLFFSPAAKPSVAIWGEGGSSSRIIAFSNEEEEEEEGSPTIENAAVSTRGMERHGEGDDGEFKLAFARSIW